MNQFDAKAATWEDTPSRAERDLAAEEIAQPTKERDGRDSSYGLLLLTARVPVTVTTP